MIQIDGSHGEGGGQILRTSLALSMLTGTPVRLTSIRAGRPKPGLLRQHLTSVLAAAEVCGGSVAGAEIGSSTIEFTPGPTRSGSYSFAIGSAGSTTLVLQTILPALMLADRASTVEISGGTHNPHAPTVDFLAKSFAPIIERMGPRLSIELVRHGFYPAGGGMIRVQIQPAHTLRPLDITESGEVAHRRAVAMVSSLPGSIAQRELKAAANILDWPADAFVTEAVEHDRGPGNTFAVEVGRGGSGQGRVTEVFTSFGERGVSAERVARRAADEAKKYLAAGVPVWKHLADQLMIPMALAGAGSFRTCSPTPHATTNARVIETFLPIKLHMLESGEAVTVSVHG